MFGYDFCIDWLEKPHVLIAGRAGSGKSVLLNGILWTLTGYLDKKCILIDLKQVEFFPWKDFPQVHEVITDEEKVIPCLDMLIDFMESRYSDMKNQGLRLSQDGDLYVIIDELTDVLTIKGAEQRIDKLMRKGRAAKIHLIMATQNPARSGKGSIPANIQKNVSIAVGLRCRTAIESRQIIGRNGCEELPRFGECIVADDIGWHIQEVPLTDEDMIQDRYQELLLESIIERA